MSKKNVNILLNHIGRPICLSAVLNPNETTRIFRFEYVSTTNEPNYTQTKAILGELMIQFFRNLSLDFKYLAASLKWLLLISFFSISLKLMVCVFAIADSSNKLGWFDVFWDVDLYICYIVGLTSSIAADLIMFKGRVFSNLTTAAIYLLYAITVVWAAFLIHKYGTLLDDLSLDTYWYLLKYPLIMTTTLALLLKAMMVYYEENLQHN